MRKRGTQDDEAHRRNYQQQIEELTSKVKRMEEALRATTTDYIICRRDKQDADARAAAAEQRLSEGSRASAAKVRSVFSCLWCERGRGVGSRRSVGGAAWTAA